VYATDDQKKLCKDIVKQLNIDEKQLPVKNILSEISKAKDKMIYSKTDILF
jgi:DNA helicase-2/ATP-dependent DNA helicase PcrA